MDKLLKKLPLPITGLMLGLAALGNLIQSYSQGLRMIFGVLSGLIFILVTLKLIFFKKGVKEALDNPLVASVFPTYSMSIMLYSSYLKPYSNLLTQIFWFGGLLIHIGLIIWFTNKFVLAGNFKIQKVFASWFIPYVGIAVASVTSPTVAMEALGRIIFYFALLSFIVILPIVLRRVYIVKGIAEIAQPSLAILTAPASLCLAAYMTAFEVKNMTMVIGLLIASQLLYWLVIFSMFRLLNLPFYPSYSAFTFPLAISGIGLKLTNGFLMKTGKPIELLSRLLPIEELLALLACLYVLSRFLIFLFKIEEVKVSQETI